MNRKDRRAQLVAELAYDPRTTPGGDPPYVYILASGMDPGHIVRGQLLARFTVRCVAGFADDAATVQQLDEMIATVVTSFRSNADLKEWQLGEVGGDGIRSFGGADYLTADVGCAAYITLDL